MSNGQPSLVIQMHSGSKVFLARIACPELYDFITAALALPVLVSAAPGPLLRLKTIAYHELWCLLYIQFLLL